MATRDFRSQQIRTTQIIASGSDTTSKPSLLIYSASAAANDQGSMAAGLLSGVGEDAWLFVSGSTTTADGEQVLFGGNVAVSGSISGSTFSSLPSGDMNFNSSDDIIFNSAGTEYFQIKNATQKEVVVNDASGDIDFRVESNSMASAIHVNARQDLVVIGRTGAPADLTAASSPPVGTDVKVFIDGTANSKNGSSRGSTLVAGDLVVSGTLYAERQVMEVDLSQTGNLIMTGAVHFDDLGAAPGSTGQTTIAVPTNDGALFVATGSLRFRTTSDGANFVETNVGAQYVDGLGLSGSSAGTTTTFTTDNSIVAHLTGSEFNGPVGVTGSFGVVGDLSLASGDPIYFNGKDGDVSIVGSANSITIDGDDNVVLNADNAVILRAGTNNNSSTDNSLLLAPSTTTFNFGYLDVNYSFRTNDYNTLFIDGADNSVIVGSENSGLAHAANLVNYGYGSDVKIMLSGSVGSKDTATRGVVLIPGDTVISGTLYGPTGIQNIKDANEGLKNTSGVAQIDLNSMTASGTFAAADSLAFIDADDNNTKKGTIATLATAMAGDGLTASSGVLAVAAGSGLEISSDTMRIAEAAAGGGLIGGAGAALAVNVGSGVKLGGAGNDFVVIDDSIVATLSGSTFTGEVDFNAAITGSTDIHVGSSIIHDGDIDTKIDFTPDSMKFSVGGIAALDLFSTAGTSAVVINEGSNANLDFRVESNNKTHAISVDSGRDTVLIHSASYAEGDHVSFFVSGSTGLGTLSHGGISVFSGDVVISGSLVNGSHKKIALDSFVENGTFTTLPIASGADSVSVGNDSQATAAGAIAIGNKSRSTGARAIALGSASGTNTASGISAAALGGEDITASGDFSAVLGGQTNVASGDYSVVMGRSNTVAGQDSVAIGKSLTVPVANTIALGNSDNNATVVLSGTLKVNATSTLDGDVTLGDSADLVIPEYLKHKYDLNTSLQFNTGRIRFNTNGVARSDFTTDQVLILSGGNSTSTDPAAGSDVNFFVSGTIGSKGTAIKGTSIFGGDLHVSGALTAGSSYALTDNNVRMFRDGNEMKFVDAVAGTKTLEQLASVAASVDHFIGVHGDGAQVSRLKTSASIAFSGDLDNFVTGLGASGVGSDVYFFVSGTLGGKDGAARHTTLFGGDVVVSGSSHFADVTGSYIKSSGDLIAGGNVIKNSNNDISLKFNNSTSRVLFGALQTGDPQTFVDIRKDDNTVFVSGGDGNDFGNYNLALRNHSTTQNAFAGIAFDVADEEDIDAIGASIVALRDDTSATLHNTNLVLSTNDAADDGLTERMRITHDGKVGIGVDPLESLHISGDLRIDGDDIKDSGGNTTISFDGSGNIDNAVTFSGTAIPVFSGNNGVKFANDLIHDGDTDTKIRFFDNKLSFEAGGLGLAVLDGNSADKAVVFNESSSDIDFRVESNNEDHMFFVDGGTDRIGIGIAAPSTTVEIKGATADQTTLQLKDSASSDVIVKMYHLDGEDDGIIDVLANNVVTARINSNGLSMLGGDGTAEPGLLIVRRDSSTAANDLLGGIGFDSSDGNVPATILNASAFIASYAAEDHSVNDKGGYLVIGTSAIDDNDDTASTEQLRVGSDGLITLAGNLQVGGNVIKASDGGNTITMDTDDNVTIGNDLIVGGNVTSSTAMDIETTSGNLNLKATATNADITFTVDDAGSDVLALTLDGSNNASAIFTPKDSGYLEVNDAGTDGTSKLYGFGYLNLERYSDTPTTSPVLDFRKSRGTDGSSSAVQSGDRIGQIGFYGYDTALGSISAEIRAVASANHGDSSDSTDSPGKLEFYTTPDGTSTSTLALTINSDQTIAAVSDLTVSGYLEVASGIKKSTSVKVAGYSTSTNQWVKLASATNVDADDTLNTVFLVTLCGLEQNTSYDGDASFEVNVKFTGDTVGPYYNEEGTYITVDATNADNLNGFDPTTDIAITFDNTTTPTQVDLYIKSIENYKDAFVTIIGGSNVDGNTVDPGFEILTGQSYGASITSLGQEVYGKWASKVFDSLTVSSLTAIAASLPGSTIGITVSNPSTNGLYAVSTTENFISDSSPSTGKARVAFVAPASGNVEINFQSGLSINDNLSATLYLGLSTNGTTFGSGDVAGTQNVVYDVDTNRDGARVTIHHKWVLTGLTSGNSYTYYVGADASNSTTFSIIWGDNDHDLYYPPLIVEARALPSVTTM